MVRKKTSDMQKLINLRGVTGILWDKEVFLELVHFDKHLPTTRERKAPQGKNRRFFDLKTLLNFTDDHPQMTTIR